METHLKTIKSDGNEGSSASNSDGYRELQVIQSLAGLADAKYLGDRNHHQKEISPGLVHRVEGSWSKKNVRDLKRGQINLVTTPLGDGGEGQRKDTTFSRSEDCRIVTILECRKIGAREKEGLNVNKEKG